MHTHLHTHFHTHTHTQYCRSRISISLSIKKRCFRVGIDTHTKQAVAAPVAVAPVGYAMAPATTVQYVQQ